MVKIPIVENTPELKGTENKTDDLRTLPINYMGDYSVIGILVDRLDDAVKMLQANGYAVTEGSSSCLAEVHIRSSENIGELIDLLGANGIRCEVGDVVHSIYRG
jgi:hypothetical protein